MKKSLNRVRRTSTRRGAAMVFALMALLVASMMIAALLRTTAMSASPAQAGRISTSSQSAR